MRTDPDSSPTAAPTRRIDDRLPGLGNVHPALVHQWYPVGRSSELDDAPLGVRLLGRELVLARLGVDGDQVVLTDDRCSHRHAPLRLGTVDGGCLQCPYHGWQFDAALRRHAVDGRRHGDPKDRAPGSARLGRT